MDESLNQMRYAEKLDPLSVAVHAGSAYMYYFARDYEQAIQQAKIALQLNSNSIAAHAVMGWAYIEQKNTLTPFGNCKPRKDSPAQYAVSMRVGSGLRSVREFAGSENDARTTGNHAKKSSRSRYWNCRHVRGLG